MPATITHGYFALDVFKQLNIRLDLTDSLKRLTTFAQGSDPLMFYHILDLRAGKKIRQLQFLLHTTKTKELFLTLISYIRGHKLQYHKELLCYLYGSICHYVLDSLVHPFIIYQVGYYEPTKRASFGYRNQHEYFETYLDLIMLQKRGAKNPYLEVHTETFLNLEPFSQELYKCLDKVYKKVYDIDNFSHLYYRSLKEMKYFLLWFRHDCRGYKKRAYQLLDLFTSKYSFKLETLSYHVSLTPTMDLLNMKQKKWKNPLKPQLESNVSFDQLYQQAIKKAGCIIQVIDDYLAFKTNNIEYLFKDLSYLTGLPCTLGFNFQEFRN